MKLCGLTSTACRRKCCVLSGSFLETEQAWSDLERALRCYCPRLPAVPLRHLHSICPTNRAAHQPYNVRSIPVGLLAQPRPTPTSRLFSLANRHLIRVSLRV